MENISHKESTLRALGALENYAWQSDTTSPKHFTMSAEVGGSTTLDEWSAALKKVQSRHPLINARVDTGKDGRLHFFHGQAIDIPLRIAHLNKIVSVENEIKREFSAPFGTGDVALLKAALLYSEDRCVIIITAHHAIADGKSLTHFIHDILETLTGTILPDLALLPSIEDACSLDTECAGDINMPVLAAEPVPYTERSLARLNISRQQLSPELSNRIRDRAKKENTTVHGALSAAFVMAFYKSPAWPDRPVRICTPIDARKYSGLDYGLSFMALFPTYHYEAGTSEDFWHIARAVTEDLDAYRKKSGMAALIELVEPLMNNHGLSEMIKFDRECSAADVLISNLGVLPFNKKIGNLTLESLWGPSVLLGTEGEQTIGVATINNCIHLIHTSYQPISDFLEHAKNALTVATGITELQVHG
ncbi:NRPS condensation-like uncharacterized protein [Erwinia toletana]|uniref:Phthiocerol/phthiodiolone dimycocerosyl transferase n=1 Tax=Winslowiella toletana TaxID=92490 RepID=A0ABS4PEP7_9GAMM|nr:condensation domain-containing protein [Winslowiella toletana]MBP2171114.1 NRPS condensation-like uncharacterized protein [Winslowiella toletana]